MPASFSFTPTALTQTLAVTSMKGGAALSATRPRALHVFNDPLGTRPLVRLRDTVRNGLGSIESVNYLGARIHALDSGPYRLTELDSGPYRLTATLRLRGSVGDWRSLLSSAPHAQWCLQVDKGLWRSEEFGDDAIISQTISHRTGDLRGCPAVRYLAAMTASDSGHLMRTEGQKAS
jgi:hypothetical protein